MSKNVTNAMEANKIPASGSSKTIFGKKRASLEARRARAGYVFVLPFLLGILLIYLPILIDAVWFSFS